MAISDESKILEIMKQTSIAAYFATCDGEHPMVRPVSPIIEDCNTIWIMTVSDSRKVGQIRRNPRVSLAFVEPPHGEKVATVIGEVREVVDAAEKQRIWGLASYDPSVFFPDGPASENLCLLSLIVQRIEWRDKWEGGLKVYTPA